VSSLLPLIPSLMVASAESRRLRTSTSNKEAISDIIPNLPVRVDDCEQMLPADTKILRGATLKIDFYLIPIMGMFCVSLISTFTSQCFISSSDLLSFLVSDLTSVLLKVPKP
jgi:hypothetical protein